METSDKAETVETPDSVGGNDGVVRTENDGVVCTENDGVVCTENDGVVCTENDGAVPSVPSSPSHDKTDEALQEPIMRIPNEVWVHILSELNQKDLVHSRTVWKKFREVVDAHFEFSVIVHDAKTDLDRVYELRIRDCLITRLFRDKDIFQYPGLIRRIRFWGPINVNCFQRIMSQAIAIEELSLTKFALMQDDLVGRQRLEGFSNIKKLEILGYMCKEDSRTVARNASRIFSYTMPNLEKLTVNFHCDILSINQVASSFFEFVSRHNRMVNLLASLVPEASPSDTLSTRTNPVVIPDHVEESLKKVQLNVLRITTASKDLPIWNPLLKRQTHLQDFRLHLNDGGIFPVHSNYTTGIPIEMLLSPLRQNAKTLTSVEVKEIRLTPAPGTRVEVIPFDASVFRYATNLKRLILYRNTDDYRKYSQYPDQPNITNLKMLPTTIEVLEISRFYCLSEELQFVVDVLENLKNIALIHTGTLNRLGVHGGIVESIANKPNIQTMNLTPLNFYNTVENVKYENIKQKYEMVGGDQLYYDFERFRKGLPQPRPPNYVAEVHDMPVPEINPRRLHVRNLPPAPFLREWRRRAAQLQHYRNRVRRGPPEFEPWSRRRRRSYPPGGSGPCPHAGNETPPAPANDAHEGPHLFDRLFLQSLDLQVSEDLEICVNYSLKFPTSGRFRSRSSHMSSSTGWRRRCWSEGSEGI